MTNFTTIDVLEINQDTMVAKALSTYHFTKDKCSEETLRAIELTRLNYAILRNYIDDVKELIEQGVDINQLDTRSSVPSTPLIVAVRQKNIPIVKLLLQQKPDLTIENYVGKSAIDYAKRSKSKEIQELIQNAY